MISAKWNKIIDEFPKVSLDSPEVLAARSKSFIKLRDEAHQDLQCSQRRDVSCGIAR